MSTRRSKVHPNYKTRYRVRNWPDYDRALRRRGDLTIWLTPAAIATWTPLGTGARGGQPRYSETVIETALTSRMVFGLAWRQTEGLLDSVLSLMGLELEVPDHTTLSRRTAGLKVELKRRETGGPLHLVVDSTRVGLFGEGEWAENSFYRYKSAFGGRLKARNQAGQRNEVMSGCNILNRFTVLGMPVSERIGA